MFQHMMWKLTMLLLIAMLLVNVGVHGGPEACLICRHDAAESDLEKLSDAVIDALKEKW